LRADEFGRRLKPGLEGMMRFKQLAPAMAALFLSFGVVGCASTVQSTRVLQGTSESALRAQTAHTRNAITYALPMRLVRMTVTGSASGSAGLNQAVSDLASAQTARTTAEATLRTSRNALAVLEADRAADPTQVTQAELDTATTAVATARTTLRRAEAAVAQRQTELESALANAGSPEPSISIRFDILPAVADPRQAFLSTFDHQWHRDDSITLTTIEGLLTSTDAINTDQTADILTSVAGIAGAAGAPNRSTPASIREIRVPQGSACNLPPQFTREFIFDPSIQNHTSTGGSVPGSGYAVEWMSRCLHLTLDIPTVHPFGNEPGLRSNGLVYRRPIPYLMIVKNGDDVVSTAVAMLPQGGAFGVIPFEPRAFVRSQTDVTFDAGQPTRWHTDNPSEVAAVFRIPVAMARALISIPAELVTLRVDYSNDQTDLINAQRNYICALQALERAEGESADEEDEDAAGTCAEE
jgi:hypothetical protein